jgi:hypothetical protein
MWQDPIVAETRALREEYAKLFNYDRAAILADIARREAMPGKVLVSRPPRKPIVIERVAS